MFRATLLGEAEEQRRQSCLRLQRRILRDTSNPMELSEDEFVGHFRLNKDGFQQIKEDLLPIMASNGQYRRISGIRCDLKILAVLNFFANGSYQRNVGLSVLWSMAQPTFSQCLHEVLDAINSPEVLSKYIIFPFLQVERESIMRGFMANFGFPGVIGCIDGTHVAIVRPAEHEETFFNRKNYHSVNVLLISDAHLNILYVDASFGGASHDSFVWNQCPIKRYLERLETSGERCWLLGDSGYAQRPYMMTPILDAAPGSPEEHYTFLHCSTRNTVERCIGVLKARWRCLLAHRVLHYHPITAARIVNACCVLHNIANARNTPMHNSQDAVNDLSQQFAPVSAFGSDNINDNTRDELVSRLHTARL